MGARDEADDRTACIDTIVGNRRDSDGIGFDTK